MMNTRYIIRGRTEDGSLLYFTAHPRIPWSDYEPEAAQVCADVAQQIIRGDMPVISVEVLAPCERCNTLMRLEGGHYCGSCGRDI